LLAYNSYDSASTTFRGDRAHKKAASTRRLAGPDLRRTGSTRSPSEIASAAPSWYRNRLLNSGPTHTLPCPIRTPARRKPPPDLGRTTGGRRAL